MPAFNDGAFRTAFFFSFSFLGLTVSWLGFKRKLPVVSVRLSGFRSPAPPPRATCGIELTVSVSTLIFLPDPSVAVLLFVNGSWEYDRFGWTPRGFAEFAAVVDFRLSLPSSMPLVSPLLCPALSLPLPISDCASLANASSIGFSSIRFGRSFGPPCLACVGFAAGIAGVEGRLLSCTVSRAEPLPLIPRTGVRIPCLSDRSSSPTSESLVSVDVRLGRSRTIDGVVEGCWN